MIDGKIYEAINKVNGKAYVGQTVHSLEKRTAMHLAKANQLDGNNFVYFHRALRKAMRSGVEFEWSIIDHAGTEEELDRKEKYWIKKLNCKAPFGYNCTDGGEGLSNPSEETRKKLRENNPMKRPEVAAKITGENNSRFGKHHTKETLKKMRENSWMKRPEVAAKISGKNSHYWKGGKTIFRGYLLVLMPCHLLAHFGNYRYVPAHWLTWEKYRGPIPKGARVCFKDRSLKMIDKYGRRHRDPRISNLYIMQSGSCLKNLAR